MSVPTQDGKTTVLSLQQKKDRGERITMLTAYDCPTARALDAAGIDALLVGDSLAMVVLGHETTLSVTMEEMLHHARAVARGARRALLVGDMPFLSYQADTAEAVRNAGRFLKEAGMDAVKLEGGSDFADTVRAIVRAGIPVMGHAGLRPQSIRQLGGFRAQARTAEGAAALLDDALALEAAGCFAIVLESVPGACRDGGQRAPARADDRHRRGCRHRRPGARQPRPARDARAVPALRPALRGSRPRDRACRRGVSRRRREWGVPGARGVLLDRRRRVGCVSRRPAAVRRQGPALSEAPDERVLVVGTGALACSIGALLARAGDDVTLAGSWPEALAAIEERGIVVEEDGASWSARVRAVPIDAPLQPFRLALVLVKSHRTVRAAAALGAALAPDGLVLTLQNGLGNRERLEASLGAQRVAAGVAFLGATSTGPGRVRAIRGRLVVESAPRAGGLVHLLRGAGLAVETTSRFESVAWAKLAANCAVNALTALHGVANGALLERPDWRRALESAAREVAAVAAASGVDLDRDAAGFAVEVARATAGNRSSMLQDVARGAATEIDALNGAVVLEGRRLGVATPVNERLWSAIRAREGRALPFPAEPSSDDTEVDDRPAG